MIRIALLPLLHCTRRIPARTARITF